ncbi:hypothetical protein [Granulicella arctica]|uniref:hypothetical protein n=1 Tax=Granulicella arctica TaxID=940613 RepID=UPI0021DF6480|nr:hypothetical protein [Granulicella arctica]
MRAFVLMVLLGGGVALAQVEKPATVDCSVDGRALTCDRTDFLKRFAEGRTLALESQPRDRVADGQLATLSKSLGKTVVPVGAAADLTLRVVRPAESGIAVGTGDEELGSLRLFSAKDGVSRLVWVERYRGPLDTPWQVVVRALGQQFQGSLAGR